MLPRRFSRAVTLLSAFALAGAGAITLAQDSGSAPGDSSSSYEVGGVDVDVTAPNAEAARQAGWRMAQRKAWTMLAQRMGAGPSSLSDGVLDSIVSGIVIENEQIGPNRYVGRLGVLFDRAKASSILGVAFNVMRSPPMLLIPLQYSGGVGQVFEQQTDWDQAWSRFRTGNSAIDYVRPAGSGPDALLLNAGQVSRPGRGWWRTIIRQYGASDVLIPVVQLEREWPGGPIVGHFQARFGADNKVIGTFSLRVGNSDGLPVLLDAGIKRIDALYQTALNHGVLRVDPSMTFVPPTAQTGPTDAELAAQAAAAAAQADAQLQTAGSGTISIQFDTPSAGSVTTAEEALRGVPGVRSAITTSLALGGVSVMRVSFTGDPVGLKALLETRGWIVSGSGTTLRIRRAPPSISAPAVSGGDNVSGG